MTTTVLDLAAGTATSVDPGQGGVPAVCRIGLLGVGNVGSAFARLTHDTAALCGARGFIPVISSALVRSAERPRAHAGGLTDNPDVFFAEPVDLVVEALGGVEPAYTLVRRALDRGIPVVTANKSLIAAHGEELSQLARRRATALRYEAACIAGVPFLGTFERRPIGARASAVTAILNGTSNSILTAMAAGTNFDDALADAQRLGLAEPDPSMDISGADAAEKLTILLRLFGGLLVDPALVPLEGLSGIEPEDIAAAIAFDGAIRPIAHAAWQGSSVRAFVSPAFVGGLHPLARVAGVTNGIVIKGERGTQCYIGPGAGPDVTAATLLDDVAEVVTDRRVRTPSPSSTQDATSIVRPDSAWFLRLTGTVRPSTGLRASDSDVADLLGSYGIWCSRLSRRGDRTFVVTCPASHARVSSALDAVQAATGGTASAYPALLEDAAC